MKCSCLVTIISTTIIITIATLGFAKVSESDGLGLSLQIEKTLFQGQPINMQIILQDNRFLGKENMPKVQQKLEKGEIKPKTFGTRDWPWFRGITIQVQKIEKLSDDKIQAIPVLEKIEWLKKLDSPAAGGSVDNQPLYNAIRCSFAIESEISQTLASGQYIFKAKWDSNEPNAPKDGIWQGKLETKPVEITIAIAKTNKDKGKLAYIKAIQYMRKKNYDAAIQEALITEKMSPGYQNSTHYTIAARAYQAKKDLKSAVKYYKKFLQANEGASEQRWFYIRRVKERVKVLEEMLNQTNNAEVPKNKERSKEKEKEK